MGVKQATTRWIPAALFAATHLSGCGDDPASSAAVVCPDGSTLTGEICLYGCPTGWSRGDDGRCHPPCPEGLVAVDGTCAPPCPEGTTADGIMCAPDGAADAPGDCPDGNYDTSGLTGDEAQILYVDQATGSPEGPGSESAPFDTLAAALDAVGTDAANDAAILFGPGIYVVYGTEITLPIASLKLLGKCAAETVFSTEDSEGLNLESSGMRVTLRGIGVEAPQTCVSVHALASMEILDCSFSGTGVADLLDWIGETDGDSLSIAHSIFYAAEASAISVTGADTVALEDNRFSAGGSFGTLTLRDVRSTEITGNSIEGGGLTGLSLGLGGVDPVVAMTRNLFSGDWDSGAMGIAGESVPGASVSLADNSIAAGGVGSIVLYEISGQVVVDGLRLDSTATDVALSISEVEDVSVTRSLLRCSGDRVVGLFSTFATAFEACQITGGQAGVYSGDSESLSIHDSAVTENGLGVEVQGGTFEATGNAIGANTSIGIKVRLATAVSLTDNVLASNYSTGIDLVSLQGTAATVFTVEGNIVMESAGLGLSARSCGEGTVGVSGNSIYGTLAGEVTNAGQTGDLGDGIGILTGTDGVPSKAQITGNSIGGNIRLGIIVDGVGSQAQVSENDFLDGNGYGLIIEDLVSSTPDLLYQNQATVGGGDSSDAQGVSGVLVNNDPGGAPPVFHGGGGVPTHH